ncbi:MAG: hypothetical protein ACKVOP_11815 [Sphingomonadaceae bacterium]
MPMVTLARRAARIPFAPVVAGMFGGVAAILVLGAPVAVLEAGVVATGLPTVFAPAAPPLGTVARMLLAVLAALLIGGLVWAIIAPLSRRLDGTKPGAPWRDDGYAADAEAPDSPIARRRPIFATDELGLPLMSDDVLELSVPADPEPVEPLATPLAVEEFSPEVAGRPEDATSIAALIRRLEDGLARRRAANDPGPDAPAPAPMPMARDHGVYGQSPITHDRPTNDDENTTMQRALATLKRMASR